jgi:hypothetical protein
VTVGITRERGTSVGKGVMVAVGVKVCVGDGEKTGMAVFVAVTCCVGEAMATLRLHERRRDAAMVMKNNTGKYFLIFMIASILKLYNQKI